MSEQQQALLEELEQVTDFGYLQRQVQDALRDDPSEIGAIAERAVTNACSSPSMTPAQDILDNIDNEFYTKKITFVQAEEAERWLLTLLEEE